MKKFIKAAFIALVAMTGTVAFSSCEELELEESYIGETESDYKPADYTISLDWDFNGVADLTAQEKADLKKKGDTSATNRFDTRKDATAAFDAMVVELQKTPAGDLKGAKCTLRLKRGKDLCKKAVVKW